MGHSFVIPFYKPLNVSFVRGEGVYLYDDSGKRYMDFAAGRAASSLGHCHPVVVKALCDQAKTLWHVSNMYRIKEAEHLAEELARISFADMAFFVNSGAEAVECGFKVARAYQNGIGRPERYKILTLRRSFHGRTYAACSASEPKGFSPLLYPYVDWFVSSSCSISAIREEVEKGSVGTILVEPIQGEGGIRVLGKKFLCELRELCDQHDLLLFFDCVQCGSGRTGRFFAYEYYGLTPDICSLAKGLGGGFPLGGCLITNRAGKYVSTQMHGSTCGGNPLAMTVARTILGEILKPGFLESVAENGAYLMEKLKLISERCPVITDVRGLGLFIGIELDERARSYDIMTQLVDQGVLVAGTSVSSAENVLRISPPLVVSRKEIDEFLQVFDHFMSKVSSELP